MSVENVKIQYVGITPNDSLKAFIESEVAKIIELCPYDSSSSVVLSAEDGYFSADMQIQHPLGSFSAIGIELGVVEAFSSSAQSIYQQLEYWRETRFKIASNQNRSIDVLLVDDDPVSIRLLETCFRQSGARTTVAESGQTALQRVKEKKFDLVVMDWNMPRLNGGQTLKALDERINEQPSFSREEAVAKTPVITYSMYKKNEIRFPKTRRLVQVAHVVKTAPFQVLQGLAKDSLEKIRGTLPASSQNSIN